MMQWNPISIAAYQFETSKELLGHLSSVMLHILRDDFVALIFSRLERSSGCFFYQLEVKKRIIHGRA